MTQEEKSLLFQDLCTRLPYDVCVHIRYKTGEPCYEKLTPRDIQWFIDSKIENIKPYLRPMSSMTEEERNELSHYDNGVQRTDFFYSHHIDCRFMIERGLALEASEDMYKQF